MGAEAKTIRYLVLDPIGKKSPALASLRVAQLLHDRTLGRSDAPLQRSGAMLWPKAPLPAPSLMDEAAIAASVEAVRRRGSPRLGPTA
jgi:hypothetical protein